MKIKLYIISVMSLILVSCNMVHEFPEEEVDPMLISVQLTINGKTDFDFNPLTIVKGNNDNPDFYDRRYVIDVYQNSEDDNSLYCRQIVTQDVSDTKSLCTSIKLPAKKYRIAVWMDYVKKGTKSDYFYKTNNSLTSVHLPETEYYAAGTDFKDSQSNSKEIDLTEYSGEFHVSTDLEITISRYMAKITLLTNDIEEYTKKIGEEGNSYEDIANDLKVDFSYNGYFPSGFNVLTCKINDSESGYGFKFQPYYPYSSKKIENMTILSSDYVFVNGESSSVTATFIIKNKDGKIVNIVTNVVIPIYKGKETTIIDNYLTKSYSPGIGIDPKFDGEWNVIIN